MTDTFATNGYGATTTDPSATSSAQVPPFAPSASEPPTYSGEPIAVAWRGNPWSLSGLSLLNFLLNIVTLGIYSFWGKTEVRKRIWSSVRINGEPLVYTGTGKELFLGFLIIFGVFLLPSIIVIVAASIIFGEDSLVTIAVQVLFYLVVFVFFGIAVWRARRYRLSRTTWRGIRGTLEGSGWSYAWTYIWTTILIVFTAGWIIPYRTHALYKKMTHAQFFGSERFTYDGDVGDIYARFAGIFIGGLAVVGVLVYAATLLIGLDLTVFADPERLAQLENDPEALKQIGFLVIGGLVLYVVGLGLLQVIYFTAITNYITRHTTYSSARLNLKLSIGGMLWLFFTNLLIVLGSLTILQPVALARISKYFVDKFEVIGTVDVERVVQNSAALSKTGEGLAEAFDIDGF